MNLRRLDAEVLLDAISQVTETSEMYLNTTPAPFERLKDFRAIDIGDGSTPSAWLQLFGRPSRDTPYQSERCSRLNVRQVMNTLNSSDIERKITASGRIKRLLQAKAMTGRSSRTSIWRRCRGIRRRRRRRCW